MATAKFDNNGTATLLGLLDTDGDTPTLAKADPSAHSLDVDDNTTGSDLGRDTAGHDDNRITTMIAVSETDGTTPVTLYINSSGELLTDSN